VVNGSATPSFLNDTSAEEMRKAARFGQVGSTPFRAPADKRRPLDILGISETEEQVYRWLLAQSGANVAEAAQAFTHTPGKAQRLLASIESKGLATHSPERPRRYLPVSPDMALEASVLRCQDELRRAREAIRELQEKAAAEKPRDEPHQMVELITGRETERQTFEQLNHSARREVIALMRPPLLISRLDSSATQDQHTQREAQARGVRYRGIVDTAFLSLPGAVNIVREEVRTGQDIRVTSALPSKLVLADHRIAIIPLNLELPGSPVLLVRSSALLDALYALFEILWRQATPLAFGRNGELEEGAVETALPKDAAELISLLAAGLNDKGIAGEMKISASTLNRRISEIMRLLNARSRFQLGWLADRHLANR
jgi:hypothetical protein